MKYIYLFFCFVFYINSFQINSQNLTWNNQPSPLEFKIGTTLTINTSYNTKGSIFNYIWIVDITIYAHNDWFIITY